PPVALKSIFAGGSSRSSTRAISMPRARNESSCRRSASTSRLNCVSSKMSGSGQKVTMVPVLLLALTLRRRVLGWARSKVCCHIDGVVHDLVGEVVQAPRAGAPDVHPGPAAYCFQALQDGDISRRIARVGSSDRHVTSDVRRACSALSWGRDRSLKRDPNTPK